MNSWLMAYQKGRREMQKAIRKKIQAGRKFPNRTGRKNMRGAVREANAKLEGGGGRTPGALQNAFSVSSRQEQNIG